MAGLRVLIANHALAKRADSELFARDLAAGLNASGHYPVVYSTNLGEMAWEIRAAGIPVMNRLHALDVPPDVIHGQHPMETMAALMHFPAVPAVLNCHGELRWQEAPPRFPRIRRYVSVSELDRERLLAQRGISLDRSSLVLPCADLERFRRGPILPRTPRNALLFTNDRSNSKLIAAIRRACRQMRISLQLVGGEFGNANRTPEDLLPRYDVVFAAGRCALESLAVGCAVVICSDGWTGPMVSTENWERLRRDNFELRAMDRPVDDEVILRELRRFDWHDAGQVCQRIRVIAGREQAVSQYVSLYREVIAEQEASLPDPQAESRLAAAYLAGLAAQMKRAFEPAKEAAARTEAPVLQSTPVPTECGPLIVPIGQAAPKSLSFLKRCARAVRRAG
jgi:hypothetical protein